MKVLVTGANGFIGSTLVRRLIEKGYSVNVLCRPKADISQLKEYNIGIYRGDLFSIREINKSMVGCSGVFHLAAYAKNWAKNPDTFINVNVTGANNIFEAAIRNSVKKVIFTSTIVTFGPSYGTPIDENTKRKEDFLTLYESSKFIAEGSVQKYIQQGLDIVTVNPTRVFGPGQITEANSVTKMVQLYINGKWRLILGNGNAIGNYGFISDIVEGHILALQNGKTGEKYILGGENASFNKFFNLISEIIDKKHLMFHLPSAIAKGFSHIEKRRAQWFNQYPLITPEWIDTFLVDWECSSRKAEKEIGYKVTPIKNALEKTIKWLNEIKNEVYNENYYEYVQFPRNDTIGRIKT